MKAINSWLMRTITHPVKRTLTHQVNHILDEIEMKSQVEFISRGVLNKQVCKLTDEIAEMRQANDELALQVEQLLDTMMDTRNETAIRESGVLAPDESGDYGADDYDSRFEEVEQRMVAMQDEMVAYTDDSIELSIDEDTIGEILESFDFSLVRN